MKFLKEHEEYLDKIALETALVYMKIKPPQSEQDNIVVATIAYKQALAMLDVKIRLNTVLGKSNFLVKERVEELKEKKD